LTPKGNVDRKALSISELEDAGYVAPCSRVEAELCGIWAEVLGVERVGIHDNFFELGGDSILSINVVARAREAGLGLKLSDLFEQQTVAQLAKVAGGELKENDLEPTSEVVWSDVIGERIPAGSEAEDILRLAPSQEGMLFHSVVENQTYHNQVEWELEGKLEVGAYRRAWEESVKRNAILRTGFEWEGLERALQVVWGKVALPFQEENLSRINKEEQKSRIEAYLREDLERGFDLSRPPLMRLGVFRLGERRWEVAWSFHHILLDGWSLASLLEEVSERYQCELVGKPVALEERRPYREYIGWLERQDLGVAETYWRQLLRGFKEPTPLPRERTGESGYGQVWRELGKEKLEGLRRLGRQEHVTLNTVVAGAWGLLLSRYSGEGDVVFGATSSGRPGELRGVERMLGLFINTLPVRVQVVPEQRVNSWLGGLQEQQLRSRQYEYSPMPKVKTWSDVPAGRTLFDSIAGFVNESMLGGLKKPLSETELLSGMELKESRERVSTRYPLLLLAAPVGEGLRLELSYQRGEFNERRIEQLLEHLESVLDLIVEKSQGSLSELTGGFHRLV